MRMHELPTAESPAQTEMNLTNPGVALVALITGPVPRSTCYPASVYAERDARDAQRPLPRPHSAHMHMPWTAFPEYRVHDTVRCRRRAGSRLETRDSMLKTRCSRRWAQARAQFFPRASNDVRRVDPSLQVCKRERDLNFMINLATARQLASLRRGRPRTDSGTPRRLPPPWPVAGSLRTSKCATSVPRLKCN